MPTFPTIQAQSLIQAPSQAPAETGGTQQAVNEAAGVVNTMGAEYTRQQHIAEAEARALAQKQEHDEAAVAVTNAASQEHMGSLQSAVDAANSGQMAGFTSNWAKGFDTRVAEGAKTIPQAGQGLYQIRMAELKSSLEPKFAEQENGARNRQLASDTSDGIETDANTAFIDPSQAAGLIARRRATIGGLLIPDAEKQQLWDKAGQTIANGAGATLATNNPQAFLQRVGVGAADQKAAADALQRDPVLSQLNPQSLQHLTEHAQGLVARQGAVAQRASDESERIAETAHNQLVGFVNSGAVPDLNYAAQVTQQTKGTSFEAVTSALLTSASKTAGFGAQSLPRQQQILTSLDAQTAGGTNPDNVAMLNSLRTINSQQTAAYKDNPLDAGARFAHLPAQPVQQIAAPEQGIQLIQQRMQVLPSFETAAGRSISPLQPEEAGQMAKLVREMQPDQAASALTTIGKSLGTEERVSAFAKQLGDKDGDLGLAMAYAGAPGKAAPTNAAGMQVAELILRGSKALRNKTSVEDTAKQTGWRADIAKQLSGIYPNQQVEQSAIDAAVKITAGLDDVGSSTDNTAAAIRLATGGIIEHGSAGGKIPLPYGMQSSSDFDKKLAQITPDTLAAQALDSFVYAGRARVPLQNFVASLPNATLTHAGQGRYNVRAGSTYVTNANGDPIVLQVRP